MSTDNPKPDWAGADWQARLVNALIQTKQIGRTGDVIRSRRGDALSGRNPPQARLEKDSADTDHGSVESISRR